MSRITLADITVDVVLKDIRNVHLSVHPPTGRIRISAPRRMSLDIIRSFAISKLDWIKRQQARLRSQDRETPREYLERESHHLWGRRYLLKVVEVDEPPSVALRHRRIVLRVRPHADQDRKRDLVDEWYREQLKAAVPPLLARWEPILRVTVNRFFVQQMKIKWGSCHPATGSIRLTTDLAKKPPVCLEYIVVHEMVHLLERTHNAKFLATMDRVMPQWRLFRQELNRLPVRHEAWRY